MDQQIEDQNESWLDDLQKNSWNPEILISGFSLAFILAFPGNVYEFVVGMIQDWGVNFLGGWLILIYLTGLINVFKIFLISHLSLRFIWAGLLGISYAFPKGVIKENLFSYLQNYTYYHPSELVYKVERLCSMAFGIPVILAVIFIPITLFLILLISIYKVLNLDFFIIYAIFMLALILVAVSSVVIAKMNRNKAKKMGFLSSLSSIYSSNIGKWRYNVYLIVIFVVAIPFIRQDTKDIFLFFHNIAMQEDQLEWPREDWFYTDQRNAEKRFGRIMIPSQTIRTDYVPIWLAYYEEDNTFIDILNVESTVTLDTLDWNELHNPTDLYRFYMNDSLVALSSWHPIVMKESGQKSFTQHLDIAHLSRGFHTIRVDKLVPRFSKYVASEPRLRKNWAVVGFYKE